MPRADGARYTPPDEFRHNLAMMVQEVRARQAYPVLLTPIRRRRFGRDGRLEDTHGEYPGYTGSVAAAMHVPLIKSAMGRAS